MDFRNKLIPVLCDLIEIYVIQWGEYKRNGVKLVEINSLQEEYLKQSLKKIIKTEESILPIDLFVYNLIEWSRKEALSCFSTAAVNGSLNLIKYYENKFRNFKGALYCAKKENHFHIVEYLKTKMKTD